MKKQIFALLLLSIIALTLITGCSTQIGDNQNLGDDNLSNMSYEIGNNIGDDLIYENDTIELGELI